MGFLNKALFGGNGGLTHGQLQKMSFRNRFSEFLPYIAYDPETQVYINTDDTIGFLWECIPLVYADPSSFDGLRGLFTAAIPDKSVLQFILYADPYIKPLMDRYQAFRTRDMEVIQAATKSVHQFISDGAKNGIENFQKIPVRHFRLFVSLKLPTNKEISVSDIRDTVYEVLKGAYLFPRPVPPSDLIYLMMRLFNDHPPEQARYDENIPIRNQIILSETPIKTRWDRMEIGSRHFRCMTPKTMPEQVDGFLFNYLTGDIWGVQSDTNQVRQPFFITVNVVFESLKARLHAKCNFVLQQQAAGSFAPSLRRKQEEYTWATGEVEKGTPFVRIMPMVWVIGESEQETREGLARVKRLWESRGFTMQEDRGIVCLLFLSALPFGLYNIKNNLNGLDRDFVCDAKSASYCLPIQSDFKGGQEPYNLFVGRKGELIGIDLFDKRANNMNALVCAETGSGKSFFINYLVFNYFAANGIIRLIDIGGSYKKLCKMFGGVYVEFSKDSKMVINPFSNIVNIKEDASTIASIILQMTFSATSSEPTETERTLIKNAVYYAYENYGQDSDIDKVYEYLTNFPKYADEVLDIDCRENETCVADLRLLASKLAFNLRSFTSQGPYGHWFNGRSTLDISKDEFVVLELEELKKQPELFRIITLQVLNYVTQDLYLSDRSRKRLIIFDEAWQFFKENDMLRNIIEEGYRRARKYGGSFTVITQSLMDLEMFGSVGDVIRDNSAYKFYLQSGSFEKAKSRKIIDYDNFTMRLLKSVKSPKPRYSEIFMDTPVGVGISRLAVDPFSYYLFTSDANDIYKIEALVNSGKTYAEAIGHLVEQGRQTK
ncbi:MAG: TraC family protein [Desulfobacteraceae bacterium]|nr:TraC family protein [Desulfobacteraceae bacterium]